MWHVLRQSNKNALVLYEPLHPDLPKVLPKWEKGKKHPLHGLPVWDDWLDLPKETLKEVLKRHKDFTVEFNPDAIIEYLKPIHDLNRDVILQPNRMHFTIGFVAEAFKCGWMHIIRNPFDTWIDFFPPHLQKDEKALKGLHPKWDYGAMFYIQPTYKVLSEKFGIETHESDWVGKFVMCYCLCNYAAYEQLRRYKNGVIIYYEDLVRNPRIIFRLIRINFGVNADDKYAGIINAKHVGKAPDWVKKMISRKIDELIPDKYLGGWYEWTIA